MYLLKQLAMTRSTAPDAVRDPITVFDLKAIGRQLTEMDKFPRTLQDELCRLWDEKCFDFLRGFKSPDPSVVKAACEVGTQWYGLKHLSGQSFIAGNILLHLEDRSPKILGKSELDILNFLGSINSPGVVDIRDEMLKLAVVFLEQNLKNKVPENMEAAKAIVEKACTVIEPILRASTAEGCFPIYALSDVALGTYPIFKYTPELFVRVNNLLDIARSKTS